MRSSQVPAVTLLASLAFLAAGAVACSKDEKTEAAPAKSATPATTAPASTPAPTPTPPPAPTPAASAPPRSDCPKDSSGPGTFEAPCAGKGTARMMETAWTGKMDDKGPQFRVTNIGPKTILYGKIVVYYYDKDGKQLEVKDQEGKGHPHQGCGGNIFGGVMKVKEKAVLTFSCVKKESVPEGTKAIEAEISMVGFADETEKKNDFYWKNDDLVMDVRKKGGAKAK